MFWVLIMFFRSRGCRTCYEIKSNKSKISNNSHSFLRLVMAIIEDYVIRGLI